MHPSYVSGVPWEMFKYEMYRLQTFTRYPTSAPKSPLRLAAVGFLYIGHNDDLVICFFCCKSKKNWSLVDDIEEIHMNLSRNCPMVIQAQCENVPIFRDPNYLANLSRILVINANVNDNSITFTGDEARGSSTNVFTCHEANIELGATSCNPSHVIRDEGNTQTSSVSVVRTCAHSGLSGELGHATAAHIAPLPSGAAGNTETTNASDGALRAGTRNRDVREFSTNNLQTNEANLVQRNSLFQQGDTPRPPTSGHIINGVTTLPGTNNQVNPTATNQQSDVSTTISRNPTYSDLGIVTERPKRPELALKIKRLETFSSWPRDHHLTPEDLSEAGFFYAGYGDCARCFYCGGGLRNWEDDDNVWVEHARWFPKCAFVRQRMGKPFVDEVQRLHQDFDQIDLLTMFEKMGVSNTNYFQDSDTERLKSDAAVRALIALGYAEKDVIEIARLIRDEVTALSAVSLLERLKKESVPRTTNSDYSMNDSTHDASCDELEKINNLKERNTTLRQQIMCKICMVNDVETTFLPCGHLVSCAECSYAMKHCPLCRQGVKGVVKVFWA